MKVIVQMITNTFILFGCFALLHYGLITIGSTLAPVTDHFKTLTMIYAGILDGEFTLMALVVLLGVSALLTIGNLLIGE